jgi:biopolymer transport protein ExbB
MHETGEDEAMKLKQRLSYVGLIGTLAPMVGLLGTVDGLSTTFLELSGSNLQPRPAALAQAISMALVPTLVGLWLAIPAVAFTAFFRNRLARLVFEAGLVSERLMGRFAAPKKG